MMNNILAYGLVVRRLTASRGMSTFLRYLLMIKLTLLLLFFHLSVFGYAQRVNISESNATLEAVLLSIQEQSGYSFLFKAEYFKKSKPVTVAIQNKNVREALRILLENQPFDYQIKGKIVTLIPKNVQAIHEQLELSGTVKDAQGTPLAGVSVRVVGTTRGTSTDVNGYFQIQATKSESLEFSLIGYTNQRITIVAEQAVLDVVLSSVPADLSEVVVVGYGQQTKLSVTGAVSSVGRKELQQNSAPSLAVALAGRVSGLTSIQSGGGQPGRDDATMYLRGAATTNGTAPLILVDGVPRDNIRSIDPNEVESVTVLKDASATAVFGVRGANGVILITTRRGSEGVMDLNISLDQTYSSFTEEPDRLTALEYIDLRNEAAANDNFTTLPFSPALRAKYENPLLGLDVNAPDYEKQVALRNHIYPNHDYYREFVARHTPQTRLNIGASGGVDKLSYFVNGAFLAQGGNLKTEPESVLGYDPSLWLNRFNFRANLDYKVATNLKSFLNIATYIERVNMPSANLYNGDTNWMIDDLFYQMRTLLPVTPGPTTIGGYGIPPGQIFDPGYLDRSAFEIINRTGYRQEVRSNLNTTFGLEWDLGHLITPGLSAKSMVSFDGLANTALQGSKQERLYYAAINYETDELNYTLRRANETPLALSKSAATRYNINFQGSVNYARTFAAKHAVGGMVLFQRDYWESQAAEIPFNVIGLAGRVTYAYDNRYLAEVNLGYNGSEQFAPQRRFGFFPAVSAGWVISQENFLRDHPVINNLKLRSSYGRVGNDRMGGSRFLYQSKITLVGGTLGSLGRGQNISQGLLGNPEISWETATKYNVGVDIGLFSQFNVSFDLFSENRRDILISRGTLPEIQGVPLSNIPRVNMGVVDNRGYEIELGYRKNLTSGWKIGVQGNFSYNKNVIRNLDEAIRNETYPYRYTQTGYSIGQAWGYLIDYSNGTGMFNSREELDSYLQDTRYGFGNPRVGDFIYQDLNGDGIIDDKDQAPIGYANIPRVNYGLNINIGYKPIELTVFFQGVSKYTSNYSNQGMVEYMGRGSFMDYHKTAWTAERYANNEKITYPALGMGGNVNHVPNSFFVMDRSFLRLRYIELAFNLPENILQKLKLKSMRIYASSQNPFTWHNLRMGSVDPEINNAKAYPILKTTNFGIRAGF